MKIYVFDTQIEAQTCLDAIHGMARTYWDDRGYMVTDEGVVGKSAGKSNPDAQITTEWDFVKESTTGKWYFISPIKNPNYVNATEKLGLAGFTINEIDMPDEWVLTGDV